MNGLLNPLCPWWDTKLLQSPNMNGCMRSTASQSFLPLYPQLAIIILNILLTRPPGEPGTTNNKGKTFLQNQHFPLRLGPTLLLYAVVFVQCLADHFLCQHKRNSAWETNTLHNTHREQMRSSSWATSRSGLYRVCVPASACATHHATYCWVPAKKRLSTFWRPRASQVWDLTVGRHRNKAVAGHAWLTSISLPADILPSSSCFCLFMIH